MFFVIFLILVSGVKYPIYSAGFGLAYALGRLFYVIGYTSSVEGRKGGFYLCLLSLIALFTMSILTATSY